MSNDYDIHRFEILPLLDDIKINDKIPVKVSCWFVLSFKKKLIIIIIILKFKFFKFND